MQNHDNMNTMCDFVVIMTIFVTKQHCRQRIVPAAPWRACKAYGTKKRDTAQGDVSIRCGR